MTWRAENHDKEGKAMQQRVHTLCLVYCLSLDSFSLSEPENYGEEAQGREEKGNHNQAQGHQAQGYHWKEKSGPQKEGNHGKERKKPEEEGNGYQEKDCRKEKAVNWMIQGAWVHDMFYCGLFILYQVLSAVPLGDVTFSARTTVSGHHVTLFSLYHSV